MALEIKRRILDNALSASDVELRENYSGRGMSGRTCIGVVGSRSDLDTFERELAKGIALESNDGGPIYMDYAIDEFLDALDEVTTLSREDSMGLSTIRYYPYITVEEES